jgi:two-component system chemotaxis sensor kinase CheA
MTTAEVPAELIQIFREEAAEHLDGMVSCLLEVESGQSSDTVTDALFRHTHSIKGSAGMVGLAEAGVIANAIEDVLSKAREAGVLAPTLVQPVLRATDALRRAVAGEQGIAAAAVDELAGEHTHDGTQPDGFVPHAGPDPRVADPKDAAGPRSIRVAAPKVDRMLDAVSETVLHHRRLEHMLDGDSNEEREAIEQEIDRGERLLDQLQETVLEMRMVPLSSITSPFARAVRDIAAGEGKQVDLLITGAQTQLDRILLDGMSEAIGHLLRNSIAHGIETPAARERAGKPRRGALELHAQPLGGQVAIRVRDDGAGVPAEAIAEGERRGSLVDVLAEAGFSTAEGVSEIAGRGVGLDAVKRQVESVGGSLTIDTVPGEGTCTTLLLPATLALLRVLIVQRAGQRFGLALASVTEVIALDEVMTLGGRPSIMVGGESLALADLAGILGMAPADSPDVSRALVVGASNGRLAVACEEVIGEQEVVVKPLRQSLVGVPGYLGAAILRDGEIVLILDPSHLVRQAPHAPAALRIPGATEQSVKAPKILVVDDQFTVRELQRSILRAAGYRVEVACDGREALDTLTGEGDFDIVVTDLQMPEMDGLQLLGAIRSDPVRASLPVVVVTSRGTAEDRERGAQAGADAYIVKDEFDQQALLETVKRLVGAQ